MRTKNIKTFQYQIEATVFKLTSATSASKFLKLLSSSKSYMDTNTNK